MEAFASEEEINPYIQIVLDKERFLGQVRLVFSGIIPNFEVFMSKKPKGNFNISIFKGKIRGAIHGICIFLPFSSFPIQFQNSFFSSSWQIMNVLGTHQGYLRKLKKPRELKELKTF